MGERTGGGTARRAGDNGKSTADSRGKCTAAGGGAA